MPKLIFAAALLVILSWAQPPAQAQNLSPLQKPAFPMPEKTDLSAFEVFQMMLEQSITLKSIYIPVSMNNKIPVTFGAEKEGSSSKILRIMSPSLTLFFHFLIDNNENYSSDFFDRWLAHLKRQNKIMNSEGQEIQLEVHLVEKLKQEILALDRKSDTYYENSFKLFKPAFLDLFPKSIFSFVPMELREEIFSKKDPRIKTELERSYRKWIPLLGEPEKFVAGTYTEANDGWEIIFKPQQTYGDFEKMMLWFRTTMGSKSKLFEAPGHQRVVMPKITLPPEEKIKMESHVGELNRVLQAYIALVGVRGKTGAMGSKYGDLHFDERIATGVTERGLFRLEQNRFYKNSWGIEFRSAVKNDAVRRFVQAVYTSRLATNDMSGLQSINDWSLIPRDLQQSSSDPLNPKRIADQYGISEETVTKALEKFSQIRQRRLTAAPVQMLWLIPAWEWLNAPFLQGKKLEFSRITEEFFQKLAAMENPTTRKVEALMAEWVKSTNLIPDIENYLTPKRKHYKETPPNEVVVKKDDIDVNKIDLGIEFTTRMPLKLAANYDQNITWQSTIFDMTQEERIEKIKSMSESLKENLTGSRQGVIRMENGTHGHDFIIAFTFKDNLERSWRLEWDGVNRNYTPDGEIVEGSVRGGHIEIVTPKFTPQYSEIEAVFNMMERESVVPDYKMGGSHINIDYSIFENNPKALSRFLSLFHNHRAIIAFLFQHVNRLRSAEPVEISPELDRALRNFRGSSTELKALLYDNNYFNTRMNRKTRYTQLDLTNYIAEVIPEEFKKPDFDVVKARQTGGMGWERQFRVTEHKKMEMRLFDAPKDALEAAHQQLLVRAMLNVALNSSDPIFGRAQEVSYEKYVQNPELAKADLEAMARQLDLNVEDYAPYLNNKLILNGRFMKLKSYKPWLERSNREFPKVQGWGKAHANKISPQIIRCQKIHML